MRSDPNLTAVLIENGNSWFNYRLLFGAPGQEFSLGEKKSVAFFEPGQTFGYVRWRANNFGTKDWRFFVARSVACGPASRIPGVLPGADLLLKTRGATRTRRALKLFAQIERHGAKLTNFPDYFWRDIHNALEIGEDIDAIAENILPALRRAI